jgi:hypothetical protein
MAQASSPRRRPGPSGFDRNDARPRLSPGRSQVGRSAWKAGSPPDKVERPLFRVVALRALRLGHTPTASLVGLGQSLPQSLAATFRCNPKSVNLRAQSVGHLWVGRPDSSLTPSTRPTRTSHSDERPRPLPRQRPLPFRQPLLGPSSRRGGFGRASARPGLAAVACAGIRRGRGRRADRLGPADRSAGLRRGRGGLAAWRRVAARGLRTAAVWAVVIGASYARSPPP